MNSNKATKLLEFTDFLNLGRLIKRTICLKGDGKLENNFEHQYQLAMLSMFIIEREKLSIDQGKCLKLALVHDLVENISGDPFFLRTEEEELIKCRKEKEASVSISKAFPEFESLKSMIEEFEMQETPESRFVKSLDKILPSINIYLEGGSSWRDKNITLDIIQNVKQKVSDPCIIEYFNELLVLIANFHSKI